MPFAQDNSVTDPVFKKNSDFGGHKIKFVYIKVSTDYIDNKFIYITVYVRFYVIYINFVHERGR